MTHGFEAAKETFGNAPELSPIAMASSTHRNGSNGNSFETTFVETLPEVDSFPAPPWLV